jgi:hypothetical protein
MTASIAPTVAAAAGFGGELPAQSSVRVIFFRPVVKGALRGVVNVERGAAGLVFRQVPIYVSADGKGWCGLLTAPVIDSAGRPHAINGKRQYRPLIEWRDRTRSNRFSERVIELLLTKHPGALANGATES